MAAGVISYGAYIPLYRLGLDNIGKAWGMPAPPGEKAVANTDEDSVTMAVAAGLDCISGIERNNIDGLYFASTTYTYKEKQGASTIATALDLKREAITNDFSGSIRSGTLALKTALDTINSGAAKQILVVASDCRLGAPQTPMESMLSDGAAALLVGNTANAVDIEGSYNIHNELHDLWRRDNDKYVKSWEGRFNLDAGYKKVLPEAVNGLLSKCNLSAKDFTKAAYYGPDFRNHGGMARTLGLTPEQVQDALLGFVGNTGSASAMMTLVGALEEAKPGDKILFANYGDGADAFALKVTDNINKIKVRGVKGHIGSKKNLSSYNKYMIFRDTVQLDKSMFPQANSSASWMWRDYRQTLGCHVGMCRNCKNVMIPIPRVCGFCQTKDDFEELNYSNNKAKLFTYTIDNATPYPDSPLIHALVNFEGGGRMKTHITDSNPEQLEIGMDLEMTLRKFHEGSGFVNYYWKMRPIR